MLCLFGAVLSLFVHLMRKQLVDTITRLPTVEIASAMDWPVLEILVGEAF